MALPGDPTLTTTSNEAWAKAGIASPTAAQTTRMQTEWLYEILNDIWNTSVASGNTRLETLQETLIDVSIRGQRYVTLAVDFDEEATVMILDGDDRGTAQAGAATTVTLASDEDITQANARGKYILITGGTGENGYKEITAFNETTKVATVESAWTTNPASGSTYLIVEKTHGPLDEISIDEMDEIAPTAEGIPTRFCKYNLQIIFDRALNLSTYGILIRHYLNIHEVDLTAARTIAMLQNWRSVIQAGLTWKALFDQGDSEWAAMKGIYDKEVGKLILREIPFGGEFSGFTVMT